MTRKNLWNYLNDRDVKEENLIDIMKSFDDFAKSYCNIHQEYFANIGMENVVELLMHIIDTFGDNTTKCFLYYSEAIISLYLYSINV